MSDSVEDNPFFRIRRRRPAPVPIEESGLPADNADATLPLYAEWGPSPVRGAFRPTHPNILTPEEKEKLENAIRSISKSPVMVLPHGAGVRVAGFDFPLNIVEFFCTDGCGLWLLHERGPACSDEIGRWEFGGGKIKQGESRYAAVCREVFEEYGTRPMLTRQLPGYTFLRIYEGTGIQHIEVTPYVVLIDPMKVDTTEMETAGKMTTYLWATIEENPGKPGTAWISSLQRKPLHSVMPYLMDRYAQEFIGEESMGTYIVRNSIDFGQALQDDELNTFIEKRPCIVPVPLAEQDACSWQ